MQLVHDPFAFSSVTWLGNNTASRDSGGLIASNKKTNYADEKAKFRRTLLNHIVLPVLTSAPTHSLHVYIGS